MSACRRTVDPARSPLKPRRPRPDTAQVKTSLASTIPLVLLRPVVFLPLLAAFRFLLSIFFLLGCALILFDLPLSFFSASTFFLLHSGSLQKPSYNPFKMMFFAAALSAFALTSVVSGAPIRRQAADSTDVLVFQFADVLERLETEFYSQALAKFQDSDFTTAGFGNTAIPKELFSTIHGDEAAHTAIIDSTLVSLGAEPIKTCKFDFGDALKDVATMAATARVVENVGVSAYLGGANLLSNKELLVAAASILSVEARHQSLLNIMNTATSIPSAFDVALSPSQILAIAGSFISGCDLGIPANAALKVTNTGAPLPGTKLTFESAGIPSGVDTSTMTCQMMTGGNAFALALPFEDCVVPNISGPVYIFIVNGTQPLLNSQVNQATGTILAGPTLAFIDSVPETLGQVVKAAPRAIASSTIISGAEATGLLNAANPDASLVPSATTSVVATASATSSAAESTSTGTGPITVLGWSTTSGSTSSGSDAQQNSGYYRRI